MTRSVKDTQATSITTKYFGPTNHRGSRIKADAGMKRTCWFDYDNAMSSGGNHDAAAILLMDKFGWKGDLIKGHGETGSTYLIDER